LAALIALTSGLLTAIEPDQANAAIAPYRWERGTVCVENDTDYWWGVKYATERVDGVPDIRLVYRPRGADCSSYAQRVRVVDRRYTTTWIGQADITYNPGTGYITEPVVIRLNNNYYAKRTLRQRISVVEHELLHAIGVDHTRRCDSLMGPCRYDHAYPTAFDRAEVERRYPW
jgi:hypothetical protein